MAGVIAIPVLWNAILEMVRQTEYGGVIIDLRTRPPMITNSLAIPANLVTTIHPDGTKESYESQSFFRDTLQTLLSFVTPRNKRP